MVLSSGVFGWFGVSSFDLCFPLLGKWFLVLWHVNKPFCLPLPLSGSPACPPETKIFFVTPLIPLDTIWGRNSYIVSN